MKALLSLLVSSLLLGASLTAQFALPISGSGNAGVVLATQSNATCYQDIGCFVHPGSLSADCNGTGGCGITLGGVLSFMTHVWNPGGGGAIGGACVCNTATPAVPDVHPTFFVVEVVAAGSCFPSVPSPYSLSGAASGQDAVWMTSPANYNPTATWNNYTHLVQLHELGIGVPYSAPLIGSWVVCQAVRYDVCDGLYHVSDLVGIQLTN
jgi:hypothetical protein